MAHDAKLEDVRRLLAPPTVGIRTESLMSSVEACAGGADGSYVKIGDFDGMSDEWRNKFSSVMHQILTTEGIDCLSYDLSDAEAIRMVQVGAILAALDIAVSLEQQQQV